MTAADHDTDEPTTVDSRVEASSFRRFALLAFGESGWKRFALPERGTLLVGRSEGCDVVLTDPSISRKHARLAITDRITLEDLGSRNGSRALGSRLAAGTPVAVGDDAVFELGNVVLAFQRECNVLDGMRRNWQPPAEPPDVDGLVVRDPEMLRLYQLASVAAEGTISLLILGETGAGKEVFAARIHRMSPRAARPFLRLNCASLPEALVESELFGHERGAFTGASTAKQGLIEGTDGGTVLLDEIGELTLTTQAKLLRVIESGEVKRIGAIRSSRVDVRFIAATNRDLPERVRAGAFRADLYYRLSGMTFTLPPLGARPLDIAPLATYFLARACASAGKRPPAISPAALEKLEAYRWPGNIRELRNVIDRAALFVRGPEVTADDLQLADATERPSAAQTGLREAVQDLERQRVLAALLQCGGNQSRAAKALGISRGTLIARLASYGVVRPRKTT